MFAALGLFLLVEAIPDVLWTIVGLVQTPVSFPGLQEADGQSWGRLIGFGIQIVIGLWLLNNPEGITALLERIRHPRPPWYEDPKEFEEDQLARGE